MIYNNQKACGDDIIEAFNSNHPVVLLLAQMQMGKSGTYWHVIKQALTTQLVDRVLIISGNREKDLRQQIHSDRLVYTKDLKNQRNKISVLWGSDLYSQNTPIFDVLPNTLIVWDEAHYAQSKSNGPYKFFKHNNLDGMLNGSMALSDILEKRVFLLTVSATPFSELYANHITPSVYHKVIRLTPDKAYYGVDYYINAQRIHESFEINDNNTEELKQVLSKYNTPKNPKYILIRVCQNRKNTGIITKICDTLNMNCCVMNSVRRTITVDDFNITPMKPTVVILCGMLRMGKVVPKDHIAMVFEEKTRKNTRLIDTGLQGLLGRMCGYSKTSKGFNIDVYLEPRVISNVIKYSNSYESMTGPLITPAINLKKTSISRSESNTTCIELVDPKCSDKKSIIRQINEQFPELSDHKFEMKNLLRKSNSRILEQIENLGNEESSNISYTVDSRKCCVCKLFSGECKKVWLLVGADIQEDESANQEIHIIKDTCVFKPV